MAASFRGKIETVDGLRGIAISMVMAYHFTLIDLNELGLGVSRRLLVLVENGWIGVDLFFVISGFLITGILVDAKGSQKYYRHFWTRRALRILPLYYVFLIPAFWVTVRFGQGYAAEAANASPWWFTLFISNFYYEIRGYWLAAALDATWSLSIEEQFYWLWPMVVAVFSRQTLLRICVGLTVLAFGLRTAFVLRGTPFHAHLFTLCRVDSLAAGGLIAILWRNEAARSALPRWGARIFYWASPLALALLFYRQQVQTEELSLTLGTTLLTASFSGLLLLALTRTKTQPLYRLLSSYPLLWMGRYSYCLYLVHNPVKSLVKYKIYNPTSAALLLGSRWPGQILFYLAAFSLSMGIAYLSFHLFEKHLLALKDKWAPTENRKQSGGTQSRRAA